MSTVVKTHTLPLQQTSPIFTKRVNIKPYEYPELLKYVDAIRHSYWIHSEFNYDPDIQDLKVNLEPHEAEAIKRTMLAISQIESAVKTFWGKLYEFIPKPEIAKVGATFSESEVRHEDAYSFLLERMNLNNRFEHIKDIPAMRDRIAYIDKINERSLKDPKRYFESLIFFSMFIENVSLFSQFYIIMAHNKFGNTLKGMSNAVEATSKEEDIHAHFGFDLVNIIKKENPEWFSNDVIERIYEMTNKAFKAEQKVLDWIYAEGDLKHAPRVVVEAFIMNRLNNSLVAIGLKPFFNLEPFGDIVKEFQWFEDEVTVTKNNDFFQKRSTNYTSRTKAITAEELF